MGAIRTPRSTYEVSDRIVVEGGMPRHAVSKVVKRELASLLP